MKKGGRMRNTRVFRGLTTIAEILLSPFSFGFYRATRFGVRWLLRRRGLKQPATVARWEFLDRRTLREAFPLLVCMTTGPRWNTHAFAATVWPLQVQRTLKIHAATAAKSAASWTVVVNAAPTNRAVASVGSVNFSGEDPWHTADLGPGMYRLILRYYNWHDGAELPPVEVDGAPVVNATAVPADANDFFPELSKRNNFFYLCMHSYVCTLLRYRRFFSPSFVRREYLPVGNPETGFHYGHLQAGTRLNIELESGLLQTHDVYFTAYNRASFPILWYQLLESGHTSEPIRFNGTYLIRVHPKKETQEAGQTDSNHRIRVRSLPAARSPHRLRH